MPTERQQVLDIKTMPEIFVRYRTNLQPQPAQAGRCVAMTANPQATAAAAEILQSGGTVVDAAVAVQATLGLVEPQSSGLGGGGFFLYFDAKSSAITAWDGRETAPAAATDSSYLEVATPKLRVSGRAAGVPGVVRTLQHLHAAHGKLSWARALTPALELATEGFVVSERLAESLKFFAADLLKDPQARALFFPQGQPLSAGTTATNPAYAKTLQTLAHAPEDFYTGQLAAEIIAAANSGRGGVTPGQLTAADLAAYEPVVRVPLRYSYAGYELVGFPPPSSGTSTIFAALELLNTQLGTPTAALSQQLRPLSGIPSATLVHLVSEAERLAYADRDAYVADPDFTPAPPAGWEQLYNPQYLATRAPLINVTSMGTAVPGEVGLSPAPTSNTKEQGTSHFQLVDIYGNALSATTSVEAAFGNFHMVGGFFLNNELSDFDHNPASVNSIAPGKRPRSAMAPLLLFQDGKFAGAAGSPGGALIIQYLVKSLLSMLHWGEHPQTAANLMNFGALNAPLTWVGGDHPQFPGERAQLLAGLATHGHDLVATWPIASGTTLLLQPEPGRFLLGIDPRREGTAWVGDCSLG